MSPRRQALGLLLGLLSGLGCDFKADGRVGAGDPDAADGTGSDTGDPVACEDWSTVVLEPCDLPEPKGTITLSAGDWVWNTTDETLTNGEDEIDVPGVEIATERGPALAASVTDFELGPSATLRVTGKRALVIASRGSIMLLGPLDASSDRRGDAGPGANSAACGDSSGGGGEDNGISGGGGGGGAFAGDGGGGGDGSGGNGGDGGTAVKPSGMGGGCPGGSGGSSFGSDHGRGGDGGGAVVLTAYRQIRIGRLVDVGGAGGQSDSSSGGGGGGSGGMIGIDAPDATITNAAVVVANGGGGAEGSSLVVGESGSDGTRSGQAASGGDDSPVLLSGDGGDGGYGGSLSGGGGDSDGVEGGGGGGGGAGYIIDYRGNVAVSTGAVISPALTR